MSVSHSVLSVHQLSKSFKNFKAVVDLDLEVMPGEIYGFLGPNGAGKSTTIRMLTGFLKPSSGSIRICSLNPEKEALEVKKLIGLVPDHLQMYDRLSCFEFLEFCAKMQGLNKDLYLGRIAEGLELFELDLKRDIFIMDLSHGMRQKLALLSSLLHRPKILFLDEPFNGMDAISVIRVKKLLDDFKNQGMSIFFSSHILEIVEKLCDRIGIIKNGKMLVEGTQTDILLKTKCKNIEEIFLNADSFC